MNTYYHNPKCSKSRAGLVLLQESGMAFQIKQYLTEPLNKEELHHIFNIYTGPVSDLIRSKDAADLSLDISLLDIDALITIIIQAPRLLERPLLVGPKTVVIGRPPENLVL